MRTRASVLLAGVLLVVVAVLLSACGVVVVGGDVGTGGRSASRTSRSDGSPDAAAVAVPAIQAFWQREMPDLYGRRYSTLNPRRVRGLRPSDRRVLRCGGNSLSYGDVRGNAFAAPCPEGISVLWDDAELIPQLERTFGPAAPAVVLAHEWGHVAQFQARVRLPTVYAEQQADCYAGAWVAATAKDPPPELAGLAAESGREGALATIVTVRDPVGTDPSQEGAHGSGFDRVRAFQEGYDEGPATCRDYVRNPPTLVEFPFRTQQEAQTQGNLPLAQLVELASTDLDAFYEAEVPGFEPLGQLVLAQAPEDERRRLAALSRIGDSAPATYLALLWARAAQEAVGVTTDGEGAALQRACLSGGWLATLLADKSASGDVSLSPGDLDESILGLLSLARSGNGAGDAAVGATGAGGFELVSSFRQGVLRGFASCGLTG